MRSRLAVDKCGGKNWKAKPMFTNVEEIQKFGKQQIETATAVTTSLSKGLQEIAAETTDYSKKTIAANTSVVEKLLGAKSIETAIQIQTEFAKGTYEGFVAQATKVGELYAKLAKEAFKPIETAYAKAPVK
jgi:phasin family protein